MSSCLFCLRVRAIFSSIMLPEVISSFYALKCSWNSPETQKSSKRESCIRTRIEGWSLFRWERHGEGRTHHRVVPAASADLSQDSEALSHLPQLVRGKQCEMTGTMTQGPQVSVRDKASRCLAALLMILPPRRSLCPCVSSSAARPSPPPWFFSRIRGNLTKIESPSGTINFDSAWWPLGGRR